MFGEKATWTLLQRPTNQVSQTPTCCLNWLTLVLIVLSSFFAIGHSMLLYPPQNTQHSDGGLTRRLDEIHDWLRLQGVENTTHLVSKNTTAPEMAHEEMIMQLQDKIMQRRHLLFQLIKRGDVDKAFGYMSWNWCRALRRFCEKYLSHDITRRFIETTDHNLVRLTHYTNNTALGLQKYVMAAFHAPQWSSSKRSLPTGQHLFVDRNAPWMHASPKQLARYGYVPLLVATWGRTGSDHHIQSNISIIDEFAPLMVGKSIEFSEHVPGENRDHVKEVRRYPCIDSKKLHVHKDDTKSSHFMVDGIHHIICSEHSFDTSERRMFPQQSSSTYPVISVTGNGTWNILVLPMDFSDLAGYPNSSGSDGLETMYGMNGTLDRFFNDVSQGRLRMRATVTSLIRSSYTASTYRAIPNVLGALLSEAVNHARASGYEIADYNQFVVVTKAMGVPLLYKAVSFTGIAGCHSNGLDAPSPTAFVSIGREFGHNMGLEDSIYRLASSSSGLVSVTNSLVIMGNALDNLNPHMVMHDKQYLNWVLEDVDIILAKRNSGTYRIMAHDATHSYGHRAIRLGFSYHPQHFFIEYRQFNGVGTLSDDIFPTPRSQLTQPLMNGALVTFEPRGASGSTLLNAAPTSNSNDDILATPVDVGSSYDILVNGVTSGNTYATISVVGSGGNGEHAYIDVDITFPSTPYCPFSNSGTDICERDLCTISAAEDFDSVQILTLTEYANDFQVPIGKQFGGISIFSLSLHSGIMSGVSVSLYTDNNGTPGVLIATQSLTQTSTGPFIFTSGAIYQLGTPLAAGRYWISYIITPNTTSSPTFRFSSTTTDGLYTQIRNSDGTWRSTYREVQLSLTYSCIDGPVDPNQLVFYEIPQTDVRRGYPFNVNVQYLNADNLPQHPTSNRTLTMTLIVENGNGTLSAPMTSWMAYTYSSYVTIPELAISAAGQYRISITDGHLTSVSPTINVIQPVPASSLQIVPPGNGSTIAPTLQVLLAPPTPIALVLLNSWDEIDTTTNAVNVIATAGGDANLANASSSVINGHVTFTELYLQTCISASALNITFTLDIANGPSTTELVNIDTSAMYALQFAPQGQSFVYDGQGAETIYVYPATPRLQPIALKALTSCGTQYQGSGSQVTATTTLSTVTLTGTTTATVTSGIVEFDALDLNFNSVENPTQINFTIGRNDGTIATLTTPVEFRKVLLQYALSNPLPVNIVVVQGLPLAPFTVSVLRSDGTVDVDATETTIVASAPNSLTFSGNTATTVNGVAVFNTLTLTSCPIENPLRITFTAQSGIRNDSVTTVDLTVQTQPAFDLTLVTPPGTSQVHLIPFTGTVQLVDSCGDADTTTSGVPVIASVGGNPIATVSTINGVAEFTSLILSDCAAQAITFSVPTENVIVAAAGKHVTSSIISIVPQPSYTLAFASSGSSITDTTPTTKFRQNVPISSIVIQLQDSCGGLMSNVSNETVTCVSSTGDLLESTTTSSLSNGIAAFSLTFTNEPLASPILTFTLPQGSSNSLTLSSQPLTVIYANYGMQFGSSGSLITRTSEVVNVPFNEILGNIRVEIIDSENQPDTTASDIVVTVASSSGTLDGTLAVTVLNGVANFSNLIFTSCSESNVALTFSATSNASWPVNGATIVANVKLLAVPAFGIAATLPPPASVVSNENFNTVLRILDSCGAFDSTQIGGLSISIRTSFGTLSNTSIGVSNGAATFFGNIMSLTGNSANLVFQVDGPSNYEVVGKSYTALVNVRPPPNDGAVATSNTEVPASPGVSGSDVEKARTIEYSMNIGDTPLNESLFRTWLLESIFPSSSRGDVTIEITNLVENSSDSDVYFRFAFTPSTTLDLILPPSVGLPPGTNIDTTDMPSASETLYILLNWLLQQAIQNPTSGNPVPNSSSVDTIQVCPANTCGSGGIAQRTLDGSQCMCVCSNYYYGARCDVCPSTDMDASCSTCTNGGAVPLCLVNGVAQNAAANTSSTSESFSDWYKLVIILCCTAFFIIAFILIIVWIRKKRQSKLIAPGSFAMSRENSSMKLESDSSVRVVPQS